MYTEAPTPTWSPETMAFDQACSEIKIEKMTEVFKSEDDKKRDYLRSRINDIYWAKDRDIYFKYGIRVKGPVTLSDLVKRIKAGAYTATTEEMDKESYSWWSLAESIDWRTEPAKFNEAKAARELMDKAREKARDAINVLSPEDGLKALEAFEATEF